jgi:Helix-turn-helix
MDTTSSVAYVTQPNDRKAKMDAADIEAARRLHRLWQQKKGSRPTQDAIAEKLGDVTQGAVSQYIHGKIPLNFFAVLVFADALGCDPREIREDLPGLAYFPRRDKTPAATWPFKTIARERYDRLEPRDRAHIEDLIEREISHCEGRSGIRPIKRAKSA